MKKIQTLLFFQSLLAILFNFTHSVDQFSLLKSDCSTEHDYESIANYENNLHLLLSTLTSKSSTKTFYNFTTGTNTNKIYGLFLCNSQYINQDCQDSVTSAAKQIRLSCPSSSEAIIWYFNCMLRYSNRYIFSANDVSVYHKIHTGPRKFNQYNQRLSDSLFSLINMATTKNSSSTSYIISVYLTSETLASCYADCTPDIGPSGCNQCLQTALGRLEFVGSQFGLVLQPSCRLFYFFSDPSLYSQGKTRYAAVGVIVAVAVASVAMNVYVSLIRKKIDPSPAGSNELESMEHLRFNFAAIKEATDNFSVANKLGQGGFGVVYLGTLPDGETVAVKRLLSASSQGIKEFKTEACLTARLQHRNLVKLFGFCLEKQEMLLVYEYMPNKSLDRLLFGTNRGWYLKWKTRYKIIVGLARSLMYLHEDSEPQIIHRDLKTSNVLLDEDMNPRVADFGIAKPLGVDQSHQNTGRVVGTFGYMAPEYERSGRYSIKTDIFSFGVIVLEILSGLENSSLYEDIPAENLINYAWRLWNEGNQLKLMDSALQSDFPEDEAGRCIQIALLCVQKDPIKRPHISSVLRMLNPQ